MTRHVLISHAGGSPTHDRRVLALTERLRSDGIDARLELDCVLHEQSAADVVLLVCTPGAVERQSGALARLLASEPDALAKLVPVVLEPGSSGAVPRALAGATLHHLVNPNLEHDPGYAGLLRRLQGPPARSGMGRPPAQVWVEAAGATIGNQVVADTVNLGSLVVTMPGSSPAPPVQANAIQTIRIALFSANATLDGHHLQLEEEMAGISAALRSARFRDRYELRLCPAATLTRLVAELDEAEPHVVHFCGHTDRRGRITLCGEAGEYHLEPTDLAKLLATLSRPPRLLVLASCNSYAAAKAAIGPVEHAIGFVDEIYDQTASAFSRAFYERLATHDELDVARAYGLAKLTALASGHADAEQARLLPDE